MTHSIQDIALELVFNKGMLENEAIAEIEKTHQLSPLTIASIRDTLDMWRYFHPPYLMRGKTRDVTELCYFCERKVGEAQYCYGCGFWVCNSCDFGQPSGKHKPNAHLVDENGETYNDTIKHLLEQKKTS